MPDPRATSDARAPTVHDRRSRLRRVPALGLAATLLALCAQAPAEQGVQAEQPAPSADTAPLRAQELVARAASERQANRWQVAHDLYVEALELDPGSQAARQGLIEVKAIASGRPRDDLPAADAGELRRQMMVVEARVAVERAELLIRSARFAEARERLQIARQRLAEAGGSSDVGLDRVEQLLREVSEGESAAGSRDARGERERALADAERTSEVRAEQRRGLLQERLRRIHELHDRRLHELALASARKLVHDFPGEPEAEQLYGELIAAAHEARRLDNDERKRELRAEVLARIEESLIPTGFDGKPIYPSDWADRRAGHHDASFGELAFEPWHQALLDRLSTRVTFDFQDVAVDEALAFLSKQAAINLIVDPAVYAGGAKSVTLRATDLTVRNALNWIGQLTGARWTIAKGAVYFGGTEDEEGVLALYDLGHISIVPPDFPGYTLGWSNTGGATGGTQNIFAAPEDPEPQMSPEDLVDLIKSAVSPTTWENPAYTIEIRTGSLFVTAPRSVHELVKQFIRSQAHARALAVQVDAKWLTVSDIYLEEIGVDWSGASNLLRIGAAVTPPPGYQQGNQTAAYRGDVTNVLPANAANIQPALANTGLNLSLLHIDGATVGAMLSAVERKARGRVLQSPSVATLNGVRGSCFFGNQFAYIADYEVAGGGGGLGSTLDPVIEVLAVGASLDITPHVSADGKYVTMDFRPAIATVELFTEIIRAIQVRRVGSFIGPGGQNTGVFSATLVDFPIELPNVAIRAVSTKIMVPDQGTILVGGFGKHVDQQASAKVPFLGHIPFFGRLFGKRGRYSDRSQLYLMATVQIINYQEAENNL